MKNKLLFGASALGVVLALFSAWVYSRQQAAQPPAFNPASNPYVNGIYANGIVESYQTHGENINLYPEVAGSVSEILVAEGDQVKQGAPLLSIDDTIQKASTGQLQAQADAALAALDALKAQPRKETLAVVKAQVDNAAANLKSAQDQLDKLEHSYALDAQSVSSAALDDARNAADVARSALQVVQKQYELSKAGAWVYDIRNQQRQYDALSKAYAASAALLAKYTIRAPVDGVILSVQTAPGSFVSSQGAYGSYTQGFSPIIVMGSPQDYLEVRCYIDEILVQRLPDAAKIKAQMFIRGTDIRVPLTFMRMQPYVSPKIELTTQRQERVDVRVLPLIFRFEKPQGLRLYPGQVVDVYIGED